MKIIIVLLATLCQAVGMAQDSVPAISSFTEGMQKKAGFMDFYWDQNTGKIWLEVEKMDEEFLYQVSLPAGLGSNDIGLDRGQLGQTMVVKFSRIGPKVLLFQVNYHYRAISDNPAERTSVEQAFAQSVIGGFRVAAAQDDRILIDVTDFLLRDAHGYALGPEHNIAKRLKEAGQGSYQPDKQRSAVYLDRTRNFPENTEFEVTLTFALNPGDAYGDWVASVAPSAESLTVRQHHSFIKLPDDNYDMRKSDPRCGYHGISFMDYATAIDRPITKHFIHRHRLKKKDPVAAISEAVEPIIYYVDPGAPEPIRSALMEGAGWWNQAFEAAGYINAYQVKILPDDVDPMDVRYNVIQWVHRSTRGWSYGSTVADPRTGEIIKGHVTLGSLRVRQDFLIAQGLLTAYPERQAHHPGMQQLALARLRQLSAHEVGHTLGLLHNFAASTNNRASVMDYPHPYVQLEKETIDISQGYDTKIGDWDKQVIKYGYQEIPQDTDEDQVLKEILKETQSMGLRYITDRDARPVGGAHPWAHLWDNGENPVDEMERLLSLRKAALDRFGANNIPEGAPLSTLEEVLVPLYLSHRYQIEAVSKLIGGLEYSYLVKGEERGHLKTVPRKLQVEAAKSLLETLDPEVLAIPEHIRRLIPPQPPNEKRTRESFKSRTGVVFDPVAAAEGIAQVSIALMLNPQRATRLTQQVVLDPDQLDLAELIDMLMDKTWKTSADDDYLQQLSRLTGQLALRQLMQLSLEPLASTQARAIAHLKILELQSWLGGQTVEDYSQKANKQFALRQIDRYLNRPETLEPLPVLQMPDGSPIGVELFCNY